VTRRVKGKRSTKRQGAAKKVGRGNPPLHTRYKPGQSGHPQGRPKGSKNLKTLIMEAAHHPVTATIDGKPRKISKLQATTMQLSTKAAGGNQAAMNKLLDWVDEFETRADTERPTQFPFSELDLEVLHATYERMKQCEPEKAED